MVTLAKIYSGKLWYLNMLSVIPIHLGLYMVAIFMRVLYMDEYECIALIFNQECV